MRSQKVIARKNRVAFPKNRFILCFDFCKILRGGDRQVFDVGFVWVLTILPCLLFVIKAFANPSVSEKFLFIVSISRKRERSLYLYWQWLHFTAISFYMLCTHPRWNVGSSFRHFSQDIRTAEWSKCRRIVSLCEFLPQSFPSIHQQPSSFPK